MMLLSERACRLASCTGSARGEFRVSYELVNIAPLRPYQQLGFGRLSWSAERECAAVGEPRHLSTDLPRVREESQRAVHVQQPLQLALVQAFVAV